MSQFGRLVDELGIELIASYSPQARGRVERLFRTLQDRLVKELRRAGASTLEEANAVLAAFLPRFNARFAQEPAAPEDAYLDWPEDLDPEEVFCFKHSRKVRNDNTISFSGHVLQGKLCPLQGRSSPAHGRTSQRLVPGKVASGLRAQATGSTQGRKVHAPDGDYPQATANQWAVKEGLSKSRR